MKEIQLTKGKAAIVDDSDFARVSALSWQFSGKCAVHSTTRHMFSRKVMMHRFVLDAPHGIEVDHINGDKLDNRRANLRLCTDSQNRMNVERFKSNKSGFKGVHRAKNKWRAEINGYFDAAEDAARAYDRAALELFGEFARTNF